MTATITAAAFCAIVWLAVIITWLTIRRTRP